MQCDYDVPWCSFFPCFFCGLLGFFDFWVYSILQNLEHFHSFFTSNICFCFSSRTPNMNVRSLELEQSLFYAINRIRISFKTDIFSSLLHYQWRTEGPMETRLQLVNLKISKKCIFRQMLRTSFIGKRKKMQNLSHLY